MQRDLIGYGLTPPDIVWPNGARVAVSLVVNYEEGAEMAVEAGDPENERVGEFASVVGPGRRDLGQEQIFAYGTRVGVRRFLDAFDRHGLTSTWWMCGRAVARSPVLAAEVTRRGHEAACHGWLWRPQADYTDRAAEAADLDRAIAAIEQTCGARPTGFFCRGGQSPWTRALLVERGFTYCSNGFDDDLPYWDRDVPGGPLLVVPYALDSNDAKYFHPNGFVTPQEFVDYVEAALDQVIEEAGRGRSCLLNLGFHLRISGRPARFRAVERVLATVKARGDAVWVAQRRDIAAHAARVLPR